LPVYLTRSEAGSKGKNPDDLWFHLLGSQKENVGLLSGFLDRRVSKSWVKDLIKKAYWELMDKLLTDKPRIGDLLAVRMAVGAMTDAYLLDMVLNRTDGKVLQPVAGAFGAVIKVELPPEAMKGPAPEVLDCEFHPERTVDGVDQVDDVD